MIISLGYRIRSPKAVQFRMWLTKKLNQNLTQGLLSEDATNGGNYFIETNLDNIGKFDRIKHALTIFDLEDELLIKYAAD